MKKFKLISLTALSLVSVAGISMAVVSCGDEKKTDSADLAALKALFVKDSDLSKIMTLEALPDADISEKDVDQALFDVVSKVANTSELKWVDDAKLESFKDVKASYKAADKELTLKKGTSKVTITLAAKAVTPTESADLVALKALFVKDSDLSKIMTLEALPADDISEKDVDQALFDVVSKVADTSELKWVDDAKLESFKDVKASYKAADKELTLKKGTSEVTITLAAKAVTPTEAAEITDLKALVEGDSNVADKTVSASTTLKTIADVTTWDGTATAVKDDATLKTLVDAFNGAVESGAKLNSDAKFITGMTVAHSSTDKTMTFTTGEYNLVITYTIVA